VVARAQRRRFTAEYKRRIVREADRCTHAGEIGALLRREGLYSSHVTSWREVTLYRQQSIAFRPWDAAARGAGQRPTSNVT